MKLLLTLSLLINTLLFTQTDKKDLLNQLQQQGKSKATYLGDDIYQLTYHDGRTTQMYFGKAKKQDTDTIPTTVIDPWNVDTTLYNNMYSFWQEIPIATVESTELVIGDANKNGLPEIYGYTKGYEDPPDIGLPPEIFEIDTNSIFNNKYIYPDTVSIYRKFYNLHNNQDFGLLGITYTYNHDFYFYKIDSITGFPTSIDFIFNDYPNQKYEPTFGDFDKNGKTDLLFYFHEMVRSTVICEYDSIINNFRMVSEISDTNGYYQGYAIGDFDMDGKTDIVYGSVWGEVYVIENDEEHNYKRVFKTKINGNNSFSMFATDDINKNGKPEFWISCTTDNGTNNITRFTCFEYTSDNEYKEVYRLDFIGIFPLYGDNCFVLDVDKDGNEDLVFLYAEVFFILKYDGQSGLPAYRILYLKRDNLPGGFLGATMYDLDNDGYEELLLHRDYIIGSGLQFKHCTHIYSPDFLVSVDDEHINISSDYFLKQNYPNPFNPNTTIVYNLPISTKVKLTVCDILGNEITVLEEGEKTAGKHSINWNGKDKFQNQVSSGIYFINLTTPNYNKTIKGVMLK